ncbi:MAG TPA: homocysteine S-methyltransferase family protein [Gaiellaceae bacterium]|nr:homocysteine S-methyltransferase family protein [Gaiellaceae bacterium]
MALPGGPPIQTTAGIVSSMRPRERLPQLSDATFITDGGMETTLIFHGGLDLPHFASFVLLDDEDGVRALREYFLPYVEIAREAGVGIVLDTPTWRANADWGERLGYTAEALADVNRRGVRLLERLREEAGGRPQVVICGCVGPRGDGYQVGETMTTERRHSAGRLLHRRDRRATPRAASRWRRPPSRWTRRRTALPRTSW